MKRSLVGMASLVILLVGMGVGIGIAQAKGTHGSRPVLSFEDQETLERGTILCHYEESSPVLNFEDQENLVRDSEHAVSSDEQSPVLSFEDAEAVHVAILAMTTEICGDSY